MHRATLRTWTLTLAATVAGCETGSDVPDGLLDAPTAAETPRSVPLGFDERTTEGDVALQNLQTQVASLTRLVEGNSGGIGLRSQLVTALLLRTAFTGAYDDFAVAEATSEELVRLAPDHPTAHIARASVLGALHRFGEADEALDRAAAVGRETDDIVRSKLNHALATGQSDGLEIEARDLVNRAATFENLILLASIVADAGRFEEADALYRDALHAYRDVSPFPVARVFFVRGVMWAEMAARPDLAVALYREAVRRLPGYVVANTHLAELEAELGRSVDAQNRLGPLVGSGDPEPAGLLSELVRDEDMRRSGALAARAAARYEDLLHRHREAFLDHGAEFFGGPGSNPDRGLQLALENLALRPNARAYLVAIESAMRVGNDTVVCSLRSEAEPLATRNRVLRALIRSIEQRCL